MFCQHFFFHYTWNFLWDILRLQSSRRAALSLYVILTLWRKRGTNQRPYALLHIGARRATHYATGDDIHFLLTLFFFHLFKNLYCKYVPLIQTLPAQDLALEAVIFIIHFISKTLFFLNMKGDLWRFQFTPFAQIQLMHALRAISKQNVVAASRSSSFRIHFQDLSIVSGMAEWDRKYWLNSLGWLEYRSEMCKKNVSRIWILCRSLMYVKHGILSVKKHCNIYYTNENLVWTLLLLCLSKPIRKHIVVGASWSRGFSIHSVGLVDC